MLSLRLARGFLLIFLVAAGFHEPAAAQDNRPLPPCHGHGYLSETNNPTLLDALGSWWRQNGQPVPGPERRLANGVAWRLHTDQPTGIAEPRITWMPDARAQRRANRLFDAFQACGSVVRGHHAYFRQMPGSVRLTYASSRLVSSIEVVAARDDEEPDKELPVPEGHIFDLVRGEEVVIGLCEGSTQLTLIDPFTLGDLLDTCAPGAHERFLGLWRRKIEATIRLPAYGRDVGRDIRYCSIDFEARDLPDLLSGLHLAPAGLAVKMVRIWPRSARFGCTEVNSPYDTIILPWRDLAPFMKSGPWRDELLSQ